jgi:hypothetical protein
MFLMLLHLTGIEGIRRCLEYDGSAAHRRQCPRYERRQRKLRSGGRDSTIISAAFRNNDEEEEEGGSLMVG